MSSRTFPIVDSNETGRQLDELFERKRFLNKRVTMACLNSIGNLFVEIDKLKRYVKEL